MKTSPKDNFLSSMASLLAKFRIDYSDLKLISDITKKPKDSTMSFFEDLISPFRVLDSEEDSEQNKCKEFHNDSVS